MARGRVVGRPGSPEGPTGFRLCPGWGRPAARDSPCCWAPWPRCAGDSGSAGLRGRRRANGRRSQRRFRSDPRTPTDSSSLRSTACKCTYFGTGPGTRDPHALTLYLQPPRSGARAGRAFIGPQPLAGGLVCQEGGACGRGLSEHVRGGAPRGGGGVGEGRRAFGPHVVLLPALLCSWFAGTLRRSLCDLGQMRSLL